MAIEDERFYHHKGVDYPGIVRAAVKNLSSHKTVQGGSTITMQLIRNLYITQGADLPAQDPRGQARRGARERAEQVVDPRPVPEHRAVRHARRPDRGRRPGRLARVLREVGRGPQAARGGAAGRPPAGADHVLAGARAREGRGAPQRGAGQDGRPQDDHAADGAEGDEARARRQPVALLHRPPRVVLLRLRQGRADQGVRRQDRAPGRAARRHDDRPQEAAGRARRDQRPPRRHRPVVGDRHDRPQERLHQGDGVVLGLRQVEVQPRRPGPPPARLDVQDHGADDGAAEGRRPALDDLRLEAAEVRRPAVGPDRRPDLRARLPRLDQPRAGDALLRQHGLRAARARPRPAGGQADRLRHGHQDAPRRLPGGGARRPHARRLAAGDGQRLRHDRLRRLPQPPDRDHQDHVPRRQVPTCRGASRSSARRRSRTA